MDIRLILVQKLRQMNEEKHPDRDYEYEDGWKDALHEIADWLKNNAIENSEFNDPMRRKF